MQNKVSLNLNDLRFSEPTVPDELVRGDVVCWAADRCGAWDLFVVISANNENQTAIVCYPRMQNMNGQIQLGQDKLIEDRVQLTDCQTCHSQDYPGQGYVPYSCQHESENIQKYRDTFQASELTEYQTKQISIARDAYWPYLWYVSPNEINELDIPLQIENQAESPQDDMTQFAEIWHTLPAEVHATIIGSDAAF